MTKETLNGYGVGIQCKDGRMFLASNGDGCFFSRKYRPAAQYRDELQPHLSGKCKVVPVTVTYEFEASKKGKE